MHQNLKVKNIFSLLIKFLLFKFRYMKLSGAFLKNNGKLNLKIVLKFFWNYSISTLIFKSLNLSKNYFFDLFL